MDSPMPYRLQVHRDMSKGKTCSTVYLQGNTFYAFFFLLSRHKSGPLDFGKKIKLTTPTYSSFETH